MDALTRNESQYIDAVLLVKVALTHDIAHNLDIFTGIYLYPVPISIMFVMYDINSGFRRENLSKEVFGAQESNSG